MSVKSMRISEFIEKSNAAQSAEEAFDLFAKAVGEYGYDRVLFGAATPAAQAALAKDDLKVAVALKVPRGLVQALLREALRRN